MFEKEIQELQNKLQELNRQMLKASQNEARKYLDIFTKYADIDFDYFKPSCRILHGYGSNYTITFEQNGYGTTSWIPREKQLFSITVANDNGELLKIDDHSSFELDFREYSDKDVEFLIRRAELCLDIKKVIHKQKQQIEIEIQKIRGEDELGNLMEYEKLLYYMTNFLRDNAEKELKIDEIFQNKGYKANRYVGVTGFSGNYTTVDEITFFKNPSGTYTITLKEDGNVSSQTQRASYENLMDLLKVFTNA